MLPGAIERPSLTPFSCFFVLFAAIHRPPTVLSFRFEYFPMRFWFRVAKVIAFRNREKRDLPLCFLTQHVV